MKTKHMVVAALLVALAILIPNFSFMLLIPTFSATFASHVPIMIAMFVTPWVGLLVGAGSMLGFILKGVSLDIVMRAAMHMPVAVLGAYMVKKKCKIALTVGVTGIFHALAETIVITLFTRNFIAALWIVGVGTLIHHCIDFAIALVVIVPLRKQKFLVK